MLKVVLVTGHYYNSLRRAGFHWLANAYYSMGWEVLFFTSTISTISRIRRDYRMQYPVIRERNRMVSLAKNFYSYVWWTLWHPVHMRSDLLNLITTPLFKSYGNLCFNEAKDFIASSDLIIFESTPGIMLFNSFKNINPNARYVYRVSDDMKNLLRVHPVVIEAEEKYASNFDLISVPSEYMLNQFLNLSNVKIHYHGINKAIFNNYYPNPYGNNNMMHAVFVGNSHFDHWFLDSASRQFPDIMFHIIGPIEVRAQRKNIKYYGELPFVETVPFIKWADVGLQNMLYTRGAESLTDSLKVIQYTYNKLPIIAPEFLRCSRDNMFYYESGNDQSVKDAILETKSYDKSQIETEKILDWLELAKVLAEENV